ncbi:hypothetical protein QF044_002399 [Chryseobacterium sp. W4I1]|nr:hypothetical protein [Chryseobacterium sp. W4I1]
MNENTILRCILTIKKKLSNLKIKLILLFLKLINLKIQI